MIVHTQFEVLFVSYTESMRAAASEAAVMVLIFTMAGSQTHALKVVTDVFISNIHTIPKF